VPQSTSIWSADGELLRATLAPDGQYRLWTPLSQMSPELINAFQLKEDRWFYWHPGVNPVSLLRAGIKTWRGDGRQGGSTLTMQLARLVYHLNTKTPAGKLKQSAMALWLEARYSKRSILEAYLNLDHSAATFRGWRGKPHLLRQTSISNRSGRSDYFGRHTAAARFESRTQPSAKPALIRTRSARELLDQQESHHGLGTPPT